MNPSSDRTRDGAHRRPSSRRHAVRTSLVIIAVVLAVMGAALLGSRASNPGDQTQAAQVVRPDSHRLSTAPEGAPVLVEFLDFECESCRAAHPFVEQLRQDYAGRVTFVIRYFPLAGHANSTPAALAAEAAAQQGQLEAMYQRLYDTQEAWVSSRRPPRRCSAPTPRRSGWTWPPTTPRLPTRPPPHGCRPTFDEGIALGVTGTPTFFLDGERLEVATTEEFRARIDAALAD